MTRPDFPRTLAEFQGRFASEADCRRYLVACRWPDGFRCPRCGEPDAYGLAGRELLQCRACRRQTSVTAGTVLHRTHVPLRLWFAAAYLVTTHTPGFSAAQLQRQLGLARYETAWTMLHKLRRAMLRPERDGPGQKGRAVGAAWCSGGFRAEHGRDPLGPCPRHPCPIRTPSRPTS